MRLSEKCARFLTVPVRSERGREDKPLTPVLYSTREGGELYGAILVGPDVSDHVIDHPIEESIRHLVAEKGFMDVHNGDGFHVVREGAPIHIGRFVGND